MPSKKRRPKKLKRGSSSLAIFSSVAAAVLLAVFVYGRAGLSDPEPAQAVRVTSDYETVLLPTPARAIARGERLSDVEFTMVKWPKEQVRADFLKDLDGSKSFVATRSLPKLLPIPLTELSNNPVDINAVAEGIPEGMRAITVRVNMESAIEGWALPGNFVDVIVIKSTKSKEIGLEAKVIAENVRILSAGRSTEAVAAHSSAPNKAPTTVTLLVSQQDALAIKTAESFGKLTFAMRGVGDASPAVVKSVNQKNLLGSSRRAKVDNFLGYAKGPDGKTYVLSDSSKWRRADSSIAKKAAGVSKDEISGNKVKTTARAQLEQSDSQSISQPRLEE